MGGDMDSMLRVKRITFSILAAVCALLLIAVPCARAESATDISNAEVTGISDITYEYRPPAPTPTVTLNGKKLVEGTDYYCFTSAGSKYDGHYDTFAFRPGKAELCIVGKGKYTGVIGVLYNILYGGVERLAGNDRYETAAKLADTIFVTPVPVDGIGEVVLVSGENFPDALAVASFGHRVLLTQRDRLSESALNYIIDQHVEDVTIVGGTAAISPSVDKELKNRGIEVNRLGGEDRIETCLAILDRFNEPLEQCIVVNGYSFADALSIAPFANKDHVPILLTDQSGKLTAPEIEKLKSLAHQDGYERTDVIVVGGRNAVDYEGVKSALGDGFEYYNFAGANRYETSAIIAEWLGLDYMNVEYRYGRDCPSPEWGNYDPVVVTGENYPDGMAAAFYAANRESPILLVDEGHLEAFDQLARHPRRIGKVHIAGGPAAISEGLANQIDQIAAASWK